MIELREATSQDMDLLYEWANDSLVRKNSFNQKPISYNDHKIWFEKMMCNPDTKQFILLVDKKPVGQARITIDGEKAEIGYSIASDERGKGYGHSIINLLVDKVSSDYANITCLVAKVKPENGASRRLFESEKFENTFLCYELNIRNSDVDL